MSDHEIDLIVAKMLGINEELHRYVYNEEFSPTEYWQDIGFVIDEYKVDLEFQDWKGEYFCVDFECDICSYHKNPRRALAMLYIMIKQSEQS